jgi:signal transduction histidine kinase/ActR/RegA family two-component response regulator
MNRKKGGSRTEKGKILLLMAVMFFLLVFRADCVHAAEAGGSPVKVRAGYFYNGDFMHKNDDGTFAGYDIEFYYTVAGYNQWDVEFAEFDGVQSALNALETGEIDILSGISKTGDRPDKFLFSGQKMCSSHIAVQAREEDDRFTAGDTSMMDSLTCGIMKGSIIEELYRKWCTANSLTPRVIEYDTVEQRNRAFYAGEVDAIAAGSTIEGARKIAEFPSLDLFFIFNGGRQDLKKQLDRAMNLIAFGHPTYLADLYDQYFPISRNKMPSFSVSEKKFLAEHPEIKVAVLKNDAPFSKTNADGTVTGIIPEYFAHLSELAGVRFRFYPCDSRDACFQALNAGEADMIGKFENDVYEAHDRQIILSKPYLKMNLVQITRAGKSTVRSAAAPECNAEAVEKTLSEEGADIAAKSYPNSEQSFAALKKGRADAVICTQIAATWLLNRNRASDYLISAFGSETWDAACAFSDSRDGNILRQVFDRLIEVDNGYIIQLSTKDTLQNAADLSTVFDHLSVTNIAVLALIMLALLLIAVFALITIIRRHQVEKRLSERQAELKAEAASNKARHVFFGSISHDMRTPLNGIVGFTDLALKSDDLGRVHDYLAKIRASAAVLNSLINDVLIMSRIENNKYVLNLSPCEAADILEGILEPFGVLAGEKGVTFVSRTSGLKHRRVMADRLSVQKIILNLLSNALKFTPPGGTVTLECRQEPADSGSPDDVIVVSDTGMGISKEFLPHIFEPFSQEKPTNADTSGSGMGLSIVKSIVDAMGGSISAESQAGTGSKFTVRLHFSDAPPEAETGKEKICIDEGKLSGKRVLLCEDNQLNREIATELLKAKGIAAESAENGEKGLELYRNAADGYFDAVLLDIRMPVMDGYETAEKIRASGKKDARTIPIIAMTADAFSEDVKKCRDVGMNGHIAKPVDPEKLYGILSELTGKKWTDHAD